MTATESKFILYRELGDGYRWRLRSPRARRWPPPPSGYREKSACETELRPFMTDHPVAEVLDLTATETVS